MNRLRLEHPPWDLQGFTARISHRRGIARSARPRNDLEASVMERMKPIVHRHRRRHGIQRGCRSTFTFICSFSTGCAISKDAARRFIGHRGRLPPNSRSCCTPSASGWPVCSNALACSCATQTATTSTSSPVKLSISSSAPLSTRHRAQRRQEGIDLAHRPGAARTLPIRLARRAAGLFAPRRHHL